MNYSVPDSKLKHLIQVCKETKNYKKLAVTGFILISNKIDEIGIKLGIRSRNKEKQETIFNYMRIINDVFENNLKIHIFKEELINDTKKSELLFLKNRGNVPFDYIKKIFKLYYDLKELNIPNLHEQLNEDNILRASNINVLSFLSPRSKTIKKDSNRIKPLILQKVKEKEIYVRENLNQNFNSKLFETAIYLKKIKNGLEEKERSKIIFQGTLKDNINYQHSLENILGYFILGIFILMFSLGMIVLVEVMIFPLTISTLGMFLLVFFGLAALCFIIYWNSFRGE
ncbi:MAG: hypothetical protein ACFFA6_08720 [Promethearchaeota archaeon]